MLFDYVYFQTAITATRLKITFNYGTKLADDQYLKCVFQKLDNTRFACFLEVKVMNGLAHAFFRSFV